MLHQIRIAAGCFLILLSTGCTVQLPVSIQTTPSAGAGTECPSPTADQKLVHSEAAGYCFLIPAGFEAELFDQSTSVLVRAPVTSEGHRERLILWAEEALGRSLAQVTEQTRLDYAIPGLEGEVSDNVNVGGIPATIISGLTGQDPNRRVLVVHDGLAYKMMFIPDHPGMGQAYEEMETLFTAVMESFTFIPSTIQTEVLFQGRQEGGYPANAALSWEHRVYADGGAVAQCSRLFIAEDGTTWAGTCEHVDVQAPDAPFQWDEIQNRFAPIVFRGGAWDLLLAGKGDIYHPVWVQALGAWAEASYGETVSGRTGAAARTALSWWLGEADGEEGLCQHLVVLGHGYAYANLDQCEGGTSRTVAEGWLETSEMAAFSGWLYTAAPTYVEDNYLDGRGEQELSGDEINQLGQWAQQVYQTLQTDDVQ